MTLQGEAFPAFGDDSDRPDIKSAAFWQSVIELVFQILRSKQIGVLNKNDNFDPGPEPKKKGKKKKDDKNAPY